MLNIDDIEVRLRTLWSEAEVIWSTGGWAMIAIAFISVFLSAVGFHIWLKLGAKKFRHVSERKWRQWIVHPELRRGRLGELLNYALSGKTLKEVAAHFDHLRATESAPFERDLKVMKICVSAAPLVGLLGTVTGMLATFGALSSGSGGDQTMGMIAAGISEALITTETGLVIALPGLFFHHFLERKYADYRLFLAHLETVRAQTIYRREQEQKRNGIECVRDFGLRFRRRFPQGIARLQQRQLGHNKTRMTVSAESSKAVDPTLRMGLNGHDQDRGQNIASDSSRDQGV